MVPEAYRQKFRNYRKRDEQTHVEFAREKEMLFEKWLTSKEVNKNFERMRQLILIEEFKQCIHSDIKTYLDEHKVSSLVEASTMADDYALTHKLNFVKRAGNIPNSYAQNKSPSYNHFDNKSKSGSWEKNKQSYRPPETNQGELPKSVPSCTYCKKKGHIVSECWVLKRKNEGKPQNDSKPQGSVGCTVLKDPLMPIKIEKPNSRVLKSKSDIMEDYKPFITEGFVSLIGDNTSLQPIKILRDTGASQSLMLESILPFSGKTSAGANVLLQGVDPGFHSVPLHHINLKSDLVSGQVVVGVRPTLPVEGISLLLGNDLAGDKVIMNPIVSEKPSYAENGVENKEVFPACAVTRAMQKKIEKEETLLKDDGTKTSDFELKDTFFANVDSHLSHGNDDTSCHSKGMDQKSCLPTDEDQKSHLYKIRDVSKDPLTRERLIVAQKEDQELSLLRAKSLTMEEAEKVPLCYFMKDDVLMRKWRPPDASVEDEWKVVYQIVVPKVYRKEVLNLAHDSAMAGHLGVNKTYNRILTHFYWPNIRRDVVEYCRSCHTCQVVGKPNQKIPVAPLQPIPAFEEPFSRVIVDCVGPLPKTKSGNQYLLTIMCASTRFPEAIPLRNIKAKTIIKALTKFFTFVGLPKTIQSDQGSNFMSHLFQQVMHELNIQQFKSSAYHPESQGALERFHQTLKNMMRTFCLESQKDWDEGVHMLLFAVREAFQESLGFSPFELVFGHTVRGPLKLLKEKWLCEDTDINLLDYVSGFKHKLTRACEIARENLKQSQVKMKQWYDKDARTREFKPGEKVLVFLPVPGHPLQAKYFGPYVIESRLNDLNYIVQTPTRRKKRQVCHVNMLKKYFERESGNDVKPVATLVNEQQESPYSKENFDIKDQVNEYSSKLKNSDILNNLDQKLCHLDTDQRNELKILIKSFSHIFPDVPNKTDYIVHDVEVGDANPVKQHPYRLNPQKAEFMKKEINYMLENDIIEPSSSQWSSPCVLVPKSGNTYRFCTDFRKVNSLTKTDSYPCPRIDDCIDKIGHAKYVSKYDLLKGYWQVPLSNRAKEISAFVTPFGFYQYKVMPFGMKNSQATFQRLMNKVISGLEGCECYVDDVIIYSDSWEDHLKISEAFFKRVSEAKLTINLVKSELCHATVEYLGHVVGQGQIKPVMAKVEAILDFPRPTSKKELMRFLGMAGYYRKFCPNFSTVTSSLTNLLRKDVKFSWAESCQLAFDKVKAILTSYPVLTAPDFSKDFKLAVDASDVGVGAVLLQEGKENIDLPICYFSKKLDKHQKNYSTIEKECLALLLSLQHFDVYIGSTVHPLVVFTDHNPLTFINKMQNKNQRLMRWGLMLQEYNLIIKHIKGRDNVIADALSRSG